MLEDIYTDFQKIQEKESWNMQGEKLQNLTTDESGKAELDNLPLEENTKL